MVAAAPPQIVLVLVVVLVQFGMNPGRGQEMIGLKKERIGQSIITAEISVWSGINGKGGYAAI
jgi:hypothetical protein